MYSGCCILYDVLHVNEVFHTTLKYDYGARLCCALSYFTLFSEKTHVSDARTAFTERLGGVATTEKDFACCLRLSRCDQAKGKHSVQVGRTSLEENDEKTG